MRPLLAGVLVWLLYLLLCGSTSTPELCAGALAASIATFASYQSARAGLGTFRAPLRHYGGLWRLPYETLADSLKVMGFALRRIFTGRPLVGHCRQDPLGLPGPDTDFDSDRAMMTFLISFTPNTFVVGLDEGRLVAEVHELVPAKPALQWRKA